MVFYFFSCWGVPCGADRGAIIIPVMRLCISVMRSIMPCIRCGVSEPIIPPACPPDLAMPPPIMPDSLYITQSTNSIIVIPGFFQFGLTRG
jgi:hypothetical protein